ncbi:hypothetical protein [Magnetospirillum sulfuroxidans]|uniref:Secreted protein n=1 Tax=Magnetospirillum sulfuroxidans TaxID=611300 RepID=A0ABS5ICP1_9PROT|nr:hypothetical protein [Magnetospirillum sulfuroxidans]MBR9972197.1 hypothetical protein [Magnetospirillum sulfuroxidans]
MISKKMLFATAAAAAAAAIVALPALAATQHDNEVFFAIAGVTQFQFSETAHSITSGQPYGGTTSNVSKSGAQARIVVKAGRKGSSSVANWFKTQVAAGQTLACDSKGTFPDALNFAVQGTLTMTVGDKTITCQDVLVAQGHFGTTNNWWMGGPNMQGAHVSLSGITLQSCKAAGSVLPIEVTFSPQTPCVNNFNISVIELK